MTKKSEEAQQVQAEDVDVSEDVEAAEKILAREPYRDVALTDGTVVRCVPVSPLVIQEVMKRHAAPKPPVKTVMPAGGIEETYIDEQDAGYLQAMQEAEGEQREASTNALLLLGLPDVKPTEDWSWTDELTFLGMKEVPTEGTAGRLAYIKYRLLRNTYDLMLVIRTISTLSGATEQAIKQVMADFQ